MKEPSDFPAQFRREIRPGTRLNGIYEIESLIATGGMGEVYRGRAIETGIKVAVKMIRADLPESETVLALFRKEAAALHNLQHEAVVRYYVFTTDPDLQCPYLAMELAEGVSLSTLLASGPLPLSSVRILQRRIGSAVDAAHRAGIVHRDISPDNIILPDGDATRAKLIDFGIARSAFGGVTVIGDRFAGKASFASPEQVGLFGGTTGPKSDIYSFGLTLAAAILGEPLNMGGTQLDVVRKRQTLPDLKRVDPTFRPLLAKMLQPRPEDRPASMGEVANCEPDAGRITSYRSVGGGRRWSLPTVVAVALLVSAGVGFVASRYFDRDTPSRSQPPRLTQVQSPSAERREVLEAPSAPLPEPAPRPGGREPDPPSGVAAPPAPSPAPSPQPHNAFAPVPAPVVPATEPPAAPRQEASGPAPMPETATRPRADEPALPPGIIKDCASCPQLVPVPAGKFRMGSSADPTERPVREVTVGRFAAGRFPATVAEWGACVADKACAFDPGGASDEPVRNVSWDDVQAYLAWLSRISGNRYRLLSEAEWEYAARGGASTRYWWGDQFRADMSACRTCSTPPLRSPPRVDSFPANPFGLHGVTGSIMQWTQDSWHKDYRGAPRDGSPWVTPQGGERVLRGGAWNSDEAGLRISSREFYDAGVRYPNHGFRVARDMSGP